MLLPQTSLNSSVSFRTAPKPLEPSRQRPEPTKGPSLITTVFTPCRHSHRSVDSNKHYGMGQNTTRTRSEWLLRRRPTVCVCDFLSISPRQKPKPASSLFLTVALSRWSASGAKSPQRQSGSAGRSNSQYQTDYVVDVHI